MPQTSKKSFWQLLVEEGLITADILKEAARRAKEEGGRMEEHLVALGLDDGAFARFISRRFRVPFTSLDTPPESHVLAIVPREVAQSFRLVPFAVSDGKVFVALANPLVEEAYLELERVVGGGIVPYVAPLSRIQAILKDWPTSPSEGLAERFSIKARWALPFEATWEALAPLPAQEEARTALEVLRRQLPRLIWLQGPPGSGRTFMAIAWGQAVEPGAVRWARGSVMEERYHRLSQKGSGDTLVELLSTPRLLIVDEPQDGGLWEKVLLEREQRGNRTVVVTAMGSQVLQEVLSKAVRVMVGKPGVEDARALAEVRKARLDDRVVQVLWKGAREHLGRFSALLDSLYAAVGGDWSRVSPDLLKRLLT